MILKAVADNPDLKKSTLGMKRPNGDTPLHMADNRLTVATLLANGADPNFQNNFFKSAIDSHEELYSDKAITSYLKKAIDKGDFDGVQNIVKHFPQQKTLAMGERNNPANPAQTLLQYAAETNPQLAAGMIFLDFKLLAEGHERANKIPGKSLRGFFVNKIIGRSAQDDIANKIGGKVLEHYNLSKRNVPKPNKRKKFTDRLDEEITSYAR